MLGPEVPQRFPAIRGSFGRTLAVIEITQPPQFGHYDSRETLAAAALVDEKVFQGLSSQQRILPAPGDAVGHARVKGAQLVRASSGGELAQPDPSSPGECLVGVPWRPTHRCP